MLEVVIAEDGVPSDIRVTESLEPGLDENAVQAIRQWKFKPATKDGRTVAVKATVQVNYKLK